MPKTWFNTGDFDETNSPASDGDIITWDATKGRFTPKAASVGGTTLGMSAIPTLSSVGSLHRAAVGVWTPQATGYVIGGQYYDWFNLSDGAQNDEISFDFAAVAGTYTLGVKSLPSSNRGIITFLLDGAATGLTLDLYSASATLGFAEVPGLVVASNGAHYVTLKMATKNVSSTGYYGVLGDMIALTRTA